MSGRMRMKRSARGGPRRVGIWRQGSECAAGLPPAAMAFIGPDVRSLVAQVEIERPAARRAGQVVDALLAPRTGTDLVLDSCDDDDDDDDESTPLAYDMLVIPVDFTLEDLYSKWRRGEIAMPNPERGYTWTLPRASRLIESFMLGIPVPPVYLSTTDERKYYVIDGMQRLLTIFSYFEGAFTGSGPHRGLEFRISGINKENALYGSTLAELCDEDDKMLRNSTLRVMIIVHNDLADRASMCEVFERLNAGGSPLTAQEARSCAYRGPLSDLLDDLNNLEEWRDVLGSPNPDPQMRDRELILRYMALFHEGDGYERPMKRFLSDFMDAHMDPGDDYLDSERRRFAAACRAVTENLGPAPFNDQNGQLRVPLFDSVFVAFARCGDAARRGDLYERFRALCADPDFGRHAEAPSTATGAVRGRLRLARRMLFE